MVQTRGTLGHLLPAAAERYGDKTALRNAGSRIPPIRRRRNRPGKSASCWCAVRSFCREHLAAYKAPRAVRFVPDLPKTSTGKDKDWKVTVTGKVDGQTMAVDSIKLE